MARRYITVKERKLIIQRAQRRCEYCKCPMDVSTQSFAFDHIDPVSAGGETDLDNLAFTCGGCNNHKHKKVSALDPISQITIPLYNPRQQDWHDHFSWNEDFSEVVGQTATGRATVEALKLNRLGVINIRKLLRLVGRHP